MSDTIPSAGYGNKRASIPDPSSLSEQHSNTKFSPDDSRAYTGGHETYGSGITGGAGFGNKSASNASEFDTSEFRFGNHQDTKPYSGHTGYGSGSTGGAGFGNKTGSFGDQKDSAMGKMMEKIGHVVKSDTMIEKGRAKREEKGLGRDEEVEEKVEEQIRH
ncbi:hypothetical protein GQ43DRAFT_468352 [Delitschia confertaspora ATCC 74209]|uniref:Uncharacterized protein n=1 Tax=Delitschia confertaspora ATCC 74209 TaxID=1513339 RepID=A0A9P4JZB8_9PLEO|nr:hypothetical protein GQ43DRAFT_468352 [Delitschia confertaspora ATCC 74209]